jgi:hypothetical protein
MHLCRLLYHTLLRFAVGILAAKMVLDIILIDRGPVRGLLRLRYWRREPDECSDQVWLDVDPAG